MNTLSQLSFGLKKKINSRNFRVYDAREELWGTVHLKKMRHVHTILRKDVHKGENLADTGRLKRKRILLINKHGFTTLSPITAFLLQK